MPTPFGKPAKDERFTFEIPEGSDGLIPEGQYEVKCSGVNVGQSNQGNDMWTFNFVVTKGRFAGFDMPVFCALTQAAMWKLTETARALGLMNGNRIDFSKKDAMGRLAMATVVNDTYKGRKRSIINALEPHPKGAGYKPAGSTGNPFTDMSNETEEEEEAEAVSQDEAEDYATEEVEDDETVQTEEEEGEAEDEEGTDDDEAIEDVEDEPPPPVKRKAAAPPPAKSAQSRMAQRPAPPAPPAPRKTSGTVPAGPAGRPRR